MLVVIVIIGVLMGIAVPVFMSSRVKVNEARVATEIKSLESAVTAFKAKYGVEPPSQFVLYTTSAGWTSGQYAAVSQATVRRIWPQFDFTLGAGAGTTFPTFWTTIATTTGTDNYPALRMKSGECLLFFLGGVIPTQGTNQAPVGFAKNPVNPFAPPNNATGLNISREGPFFELHDIARIKDVDSNGINEWYDTIPNQGKPYLYFSSYEGAGYRVAGVTSELPTADTLADVYRIWSPPSATPTATPPVPGPLTQTLTPQKAQTFQIISPGYDGEYGYGGVHNDSLTNSGLQQNTVTGKYPDADNITNFSGGRLVK